MGLVELARFRTKVEADLARLLLEAEDITAVLFDEGMNYSLGSLMPVRLMVLDQEYDEAAALLIKDGML